MKKRKIKSELNKAQTPPTWRTLLSYLFARPLVWLTGIAIVATGSFLDTSIKSALKKLMETPVEKVLEWKCQLQRAPSTSVTQFKILLSPLVGDSSHKITGRIQDAFLAESGLDVVQICERVDFDRSKGTDESKIELRNQAKEIISKNQADLLIFGSVLSNRKLRIYAVNEFGGCDLAPTPVLVEDGEISKDFDRDTKQKLVSASLSEIDAACLHPESVDLQLFAKRAKKLEVFIRGASANFEAESRWNLIGSYFNAVSILYKHNGGDDWADKGITLGVENIDGINKHSGDLWYLIGTLHSAKYNKTKSQTEINEAIETYGKAIESSNDYQYDALVARGEMRKSAGDLKLAIEDFSRAISKDPKNGDAFHHRSIALRDDNQIDAAIVDATEAINLTPEDAIDRSSRGVMYMTKGYSDKAISDFTAALQIAPDDASTLTDRAMAYRSRQDFEMAITDLEKAKSISPGGASSWHNLCSTQNKAGKLAEAFDNCSKAISIDDHLSSAFDERARVLLKMQKFDNAIADFSTAYTINKNLTRSIYGRGISKRAKGDNSGAESDIALAKSIQPTVADEFNGL